MKKIELTAIYFLLRPLTAVLKFHLYGLLTQVDGSQLKFVLIKVYKSIQV